MDMWCVYYNTRLNGEFFVSVGKKCPLCSVSFDNFDKITINCYSSSECTKTELILLRIRNMVFHNKKLKYGEFDPEHTCGNINDPHFINLNVYMDENTRLTNAFWNNEIQPTINMPCNMAYTYQVGKYRRFKFTDLVNFPFVWPKN